MENDPTDQQIMVVFLCFCSALVTVALLHGIQSSLLIPVIITAWLISPGAMLLAMWLEFYRDEEGVVRSPLRRFFDLRVQSWALVFGDTICLPVSLAASAHGWRYLPSDSIYRQVTWWVLALQAGVLFALFFRWVDTANYRRQDALQALSSPVKWTHEASAVFGLFAGLVFGGVPLLHLWLWPHLGWFLAGVGGWIMLGALDVKRGAMCRERHVAWDAVTFRPAHWK